MELKNYQKRVLKDLDKFIIILDKEKTKHIKIAKMLQQNDEVYIPEQQNFCKNALRL